MIEAACALVLSPFRHEGMKQDGQIWTETRIGAAEGCSLRNVDAGGNAYLSEGYSKASWMVASTRIDNPCKSRNEEAGER